MILTATVGFIAGAMLGLRFTVKMLANVCFLGCLIWGGLALSGHIAASTALFAGIVSLVTLQIGYCTTILLAAMGIVEHRADLQNHPIGEPAPLQIAATARPDEPR